MLETFDPRDTADRAVLSDWLLDAGRDAEAATVRRAGWPVHLDGGRVRPVDAHDVECIAEGMRETFSTDADDPYPVPDVDALTDWHGYPTWTAAGVKASEADALAWLLTLDGPALAAACDTPQTAGACLADARLFNRLARFAAAGFGPAVAVELYRAARAMPRVRVFIDQRGHYEYDPEPECGR